MALCQRQAAGFREQVAELHRLIVDGAAVRFRDVLERSVMLLVRNLLYKRRLAELLLDVTLVTLAYYGAYRLRFDEALPPDYVLAFQSTLGVVIAVKVIALGALGVYRGAWRYVGMVDLYRIVGAVLLSGAVIMAYGQWRVPALARSHSIVYIDTLLSAALILTSRLSFRSLETIGKWLRVKGDRVLIYGAGDAGELILRELVNNDELNLQPTCFIDDDQRKHGANIHGVPVVGGRESLALAVQRYGVQKIVLYARRPQIRGQRSERAVHRLPTSERHPTERSLRTAR